MMMRRWSPSLRCEQLGALPHRLPPQDLKVLGPLHEEAGELVAQDLLDLVRLRASECNVRRGRGTAR